MGMFLLLGQVCSMESNKIKSNALAVADHPVFLEINKKLKYSSNLVHIVL
jgi:hypothetical protein